MPPPKPVTGKELPVGYDRMIWEWIYSMQLSSPSRYLSVGQGAGGQTVNLNISRIIEDISANIVNETGGDTYNGYFKATQTADDKIKIVWGLYPESSYAGKVNVNYFPKDVATVEFTITENCYIYLECKLLGSPTATGATAEILQSTTYPESEVGTYRDLISEVVFADSKISDFSRHNVNKNILMSGGCSTT